MGFLLTRVAAISAYLAELTRRGVPEHCGSLDEEVVFILDGVGGCQFAPLLVRRAFRQEGIELGTIVFNWQFGVPGEIWTDLMWLRRNRLMAGKLARKLLAFRRAHPRTVIHVLAYSGGAGIAVFALERLRGRQLVDTLILACPALSPQYNLGPALRSAKRCFALVSRRDRGILGLGTRIFGTTDRKHSAAAGMTSFSIPESASADDVDEYRKLREVRWTPELQADGHTGGHTGWVSSPLLRRHLLPLLRGTPDLPLHEVSKAP